MFWFLIAITIALGAVYGGWRWSILLGCAAAVLALARQGEPTTQPPSVVRIKANETGTGQKTCRRCHPAEWKTWNASYHKTMTQLPSDETVLAPFKQDLNGLSGRWRLFQDEGLYKAEHTEPNGRVKTATVALLTGSHHMQNYWLSVGDGWLIQLPWVWWIKGQRWIPVEMSFLRPAPTGPEPPSVWNDECVYCHTTSGFRGADRAANTTQSQVDELGISCESCHGSATAHVAHYQSPINRYLGWLNRPVEKITAPLKPTDDSINVCGQCHGLFAHLNGRARDLAGDSHKPGDDLAKTRKFLRLTPSPLVGKRPILKSKEGRGPTVIRGSSGPLHLVGLSTDGLHLVGGPKTPQNLSVFVGELALNGEFEPYSGGGFLSVPTWTDRQWYGILDALGYSGVAFKPYDWNAFWDDGTMRTAGRALNGMLDSACASAGSMTCSTCHTMHGHEPDDQLKAGYRGNKACESCHKAYVDDPVSHSNHPLSGGGSDCQNCHMPHTTYGLLGASRTHRVENPRPFLMQQRGRPNACNLCHMDKSVRWAQSWTDKWYGKKGKDMPLDRRPALDEPAGLVWLLSGDAAQRAIALWHLGWGYTREIAGTDRWLDQLKPILKSDPYAAVRAIFEQVLKTVQPDEKYDFTQWPADGHHPMERADQGKAVPTVHTESLYQSLLEDRIDRPIIIAE
ncbi:MAG: multiheme c-type cytochrome [Myxococcota bacterium]|nr:multiheme c-type cytochrome [Myxococcota bacterium]